MPILDFPSAHINDKDAETLPSVALGILQGADDATLSEIAASDMVYRDFTYTLSIMCAPDNPDFHVRINHALSAHELYEAAKIMRDWGLSADIDLDVALSFGDRENWKNLFDSAVRNDKVAHVVSGYILRWIVSRWRNSSTLAEASLSKAASIAEEWATTHRIVGAKKQNVIRNIWTKYSCVSHLWAALHLAQEAEFEITTPHGFTVFCNTAQWLLEQGAQITPKGRREGESVLSLAQSWSIPESHLIRAHDNSIRIQLWNNELGAHDIREMRGAFQVQKPV